jgi:hypothetical protein
MAGILELAQMDRSVSQMGGQDNFQGLDSENLRFAKTLLDDDFKNIPTDFLPIITKTFWVFRDKELALTNLEPNDVDILMSDLRIAILNYKQSIPDYELSYDKIISLDQMYAKVYVKLKRSTGGMNRERAMLTMQIKQFLTNEQERSGGGIMGTIKGMFGGRK